MNYKRTILTAVFILLLFIPQMVSANSSWVWISETRPYDILPWVAAATILVETWMIHRCQVKQKTWKTTIIVSVANLVSFLFPYIVTYCKLAPVKGYVTFSEMFEHWPTYTVGAVFLFMTVVLEFPIVYFSLGEKVEDKRKLKLMILMSNVITTIMVAMVERVFCQGSW